MISPKEISPAKKASIRNAIISVTVMTNRLKKMRIKIFAESLAIFIMNDDSIAIHLELFVIFFII